MVGADGWPIPIDDYQSELCELEADVLALESLGVTFIDVEPPLGVREISGSPTDSGQEELER
ncbi:hypothetical protein AB0I30_24930 [Nocardia tengchongensis]|uniref:hypothetical protein n=1 Tax=Nocardia tengchongensis TaxID=2055889 RepID=UPI0033DB7834